MTVQHNNFTVENRYPKIYSNIQIWCKEKKLLEPKVLFLGCSSGLEIVTFLKYMPMAETIGIDVSNEHVEKARSNLGKKSTILHGDIFSDSGLVNAKFDIVFANSVLCDFPRSQKLDDLLSHYPFENFNHQVSVLDHFVKHNGLLVITNSNYCFEDTDCSDKYVVSKLFSEIGSGHVPKFNRSSKKIEHTKRALITRLKILFQILISKFLKVIDKKAGVLYREHKSFTWSYYKSSVFQKVHNEGARQH